MSPVHGRQGAYYHAAMQKLMQAMTKHANSHADDALDFQALFEAAPTPFLVLSLDFVIVAVNNAYLQATHTSRAEILGRHLFEVFPDNPDDPAATGVANLRASLQRVLKNRAADTMAIQKYDIYVKTEEGGSFTERYWSPINTPVFDEEGRMTHIIHRVEDVTAFMNTQLLAKQMESKIAAQTVEIQAANRRLRDMNVALDRRVSERTRELMAEREHLRSLLMAVPVPVAVVLGSELRYYLRNDAHKEMLKGVDVIGKTVREALPNAGEYMLPVLTKVYDTGQPFYLKRQKVVWDREQVGTPAEHYYDLLAHPLFGADEKVEGVIAVSQEVTAQVQVEANINEALTNLQKERQMREQFVLMLTHDLRSPLAAATMSAHLIARKAGEPVEVGRLAGRIVSSVDRAERMIQDLLDANLIRAGEKLPIETRPGSLRDIVAAALDELTTIHGDRFRFHAPDPIDGDWNASGIQRVLENLCGNAIKYGEPNRPVTVGLLWEGKRVVIEVHNEGPAIPLEEQATLFEPFHRSRTADLAKHPGWGIGLTLVRGIAEAHSGVVEVTSLPGQGTSFRVVLPSGGRPPRRR